MRVHGCILGRQSGIGEGLVIRSPPLYQLNYGRESYPLLTQGAGQPRAQKSSSDSLNTVALKQ